METPTLTGPRPIPSADDLEVNLQKVWGVQGWMRLPRRMRYLYLIEAFLADVAGSNRRAGEVGLRNQILDVINDIREKTYQPMLTNPGTPPPTTP